MAIKMILIADDAETIQIEKKLAEKNEYIFEAYSTEKWKIIERHLNKHLSSKEMASIASLPQGYQPIGDYKISLKDTIQAALRRHAGNIEACAGDLKMGRATLYRKIKTLNISLQEYKPIKEVKKDDNVIQLVSARTRLKKSA